MSNRPNYNELEKTFARPAKTKSKGAGTGGFTRLENGWDQLFRRVGPTAFSVYLLLRRFAGFLNPGRAMQARREGLTQEWIAEQLDFHLNTVNQAVKILQRVGVVEARRHRRGPADYWVRRTDDREVREVLDSQLTGNQETILDSQETGQPDSQKTGYPLKKEEGRAGLKAGRPGEIRIVHFDSDLALAACSA